MNEWITDLLALQDLDMKIRNLKLRIDTIPAEKKRLNSLVKDAMDDVEVAKDGLRRIERNIKDQEGEAEKLNEASRKLLTQSAMVKKNNEYQAMMADIEAKKKAISDIETKILELLAVNKNEVVRREAVLSRFWGVEDKDYFASRSLDVFIKKIRTALEDEPAVELKTIRGVGFKLIAE